MERATALFQAQAELYVHCSISRTFMLSVLRLYKKPDELVTAVFSEQLESLEAFWESELPRLGEEGALGWAAWESSGRPENDREPAPRTERPHAQIQDPYARWAHEESQVDRSQDLPARSTSDDDPYAVIFFSDIQPFLLDLRSGHSIEVFRLMWLSFTGLHIPGFSASLSRPDLPRPIPPKPPFISTCLLLPGINRAQDEVMITIISYTS